MLDINKIQETWKSHEEKLEKSMALNIELLRRMNVKSAKSKINPLIWYNAFMIVLYQATLWLSIYFIVSNWNQIYFMISGAILAIWSAVISYGAIKQLKLILEINYAEPVTMVQKQLQELKIATIHFLRLGFMILPFWVVFPIIILKLFFNVDFIEIMSPVWLIVNTVVMLFAAIWIYWVVSPRNVDKKWIQWLDGTSIQINKAQEFMEEIDAFEKE